MANTLELYNISFQCIYVVMCTTLGLILDPASYSMPYLPEIGILL